MRSGVVCAELGFTRLTNNDRVKQEVGLHLRFLSHLLSVAGCPMPG